MLEIGNEIVSLDLLEEFFSCDLRQCKGACCIEGDSGAPLTEDEALVIEENFKHYRKYLPEEHLKEIERTGYSVVDSDGDLVTPLVSNRQCAYSFYDRQEVLRCAIEKSYHDGLTRFIKPVSCHLFPVRITEYDTFKAVNYQQISICKSGRECGFRMRLPLYVFLKDPLIRQFGEQWYHQLEEAALLLKESHKLPE